MLPICTVDICPPGLKFVTLEIFDHPNPISGHRRFHTLKYSARPTVFPPLAHNSPGTLQNYNYVSGLSPKINPSQLTLDVTSFSRRCSSTQATPSKASTCCESPRQPSTWLLLTTAAPTHKASGFLGRVLPPFTIGLGAQGVQHRSAS